MHYLFDHLIIFEDDKKEQVKRRHNYLSTYLYMYIYMCPYAHQKQLYLNIKFI